MGKILPELMQLKKYVISVAPCWILAVPLINVSKFQINLISYINIQFGNLGFIKVHEK